MPPPAAGAGSLFLASGMPATPRRSRHGLPRHGTRASRVSVVPACGREPASGGRDTGAGAPARAVCDAPLLERTEYRRCARSQGVRARLRGSALSNTGRRQTAPRQGTRCAAYSIPRAIMEGGGPADRATYGAIDLPHQEQQCKGGQETKNGSPRWDVGLASLPHPLARPSVSMG
jgi:hypothetical protein